MAAILEVSGLKKSYKNFELKNVSFSIHEDPCVFNYVSMRNPNNKLREGMVIAIEPMINMGSWRIKDLEDGWTVKTVDGSVACHWEHTVAITENGAEIMTI